MSDSGKNKGNTPVPPRGARKGGRPGPKTAPRAGSAGGKPPGRRAAAEARRRRRNLFALLAVVVVVAIIAVLVVLGVQSTNQKGAPRTPVPAELTSALTTVPVSTLVAANNQVPAADLVGAETLSATPLTSNGKPEILYIGAEFCPICATERWAMTVALSQFGSFHNLQQTRSAVRDGDLATLSFYKSTYSSPYLDFVPVEMTTNQPKGNFYVPLENPTPAQQSLWTATLQKFGQQASYPFVDIGGKYLIFTAQYSEQDISGLSFAQIASQVGNNNTKLGAEIDASAAQLTHYICGITASKPANVCNAVANVRLAAPPSAQASTSPATT